MSNLPPYIKLKQSKRARRLALRLDTKERVFHLVQPKGVSLARARAFAENHDDWMQERLQELPPLMPFTHGAILPILGQERKLSIIKRMDSKRTSIRLIGDYLEVLTNQDDPSMRITRWLKTLAKERLAEKSQEKAALIGKHIHSVTVRDTKSRWGSCSHDGKLSYSWRLIFSPSNAFDYVVAHEVAHLQHLDHSKSFWALCQKLSDNYLDGKYWMRNHASELMRYG